MPSLWLSPGPCLGFTTDMSMHFFGRPGRYSRLLLTQVLLCMALVLGLACSGSSESNGTDGAVTDSSSKATESSMSNASPICDELDAVRRAVEEVQIAVRAGDVSGTQVAIAN